MQRLGIAVLHVDGDPGNDVRVEFVLPDHLDQYLANLVTVQPLAIGPLLGQRLKDIGDGNQPRLEFQLIPLQSKRIAAAIQTFMMIGRPSGYIFKADDPGQDLEGLIGMMVDPAPFMPVQSPRLVEDFSGICSLPRSCRRPAISILSQISSPSPNCSAR